MCELFAVGRRTLLCHDMPEKAEEVADRSGRDEQVPDHVGVGQRSPEIEDAAERVKSLKCRKLSYWFSITKS